MLAIKHSEDAIFSEIKCRDLGKINLVTGNNNSGKTALLEKITKSRTLIIGIKTNEALKDSLVSYLKSLDGWRASGPHRDRVIESIANSTLFSKNDEGYIYSDDIQRLSGSFVQLAKGHYMYPIADYFEKWFRSNIQKEKSRKYIPTKRAIPTSMRVENDSEFREKGSNLINKLYYLRDSLPGTDGEKTYKKLQELFIEVTNGLSFHLRIEGESNITLFFVDKNGKSISADKSGLGLTEVLMILYVTFATDDDLICIDEIESHLHPDMQRRLMGVLDKNFTRTLIISTHSNVILNSVSSAKVFMTKVKNAKIHVDDTSSMAEILSSIGYSVVDNLVSDLVLLVEGKHDISAYREILIKFEIIPRFNIKIWQLGGNDMDSHDLSVVKQNNVVYAIIDRDDGSRESREKFKQNCIECGIKCHQLARYSFENYIPIEIIKEVCGPGSVPSGLSAIDPDKSVKDQGIALSKKKIYAMAKSMTKEFIENTDIFKVISDIRSMLEQSRRVS